MKHSFTQLTLLGGLLFLFTLTAKAQLPTTITHCYNGPTVTVDASGDYGVSLPAVDFTALDFPSGSTITNVEVEIVFNKTDGTCAAPGTGSSFHGETTFRLTSPLGQEFLALPDTWSGNVSTNNVTVTFDQSAASIPSVTPVTGTFKPNNGDLSNYNGMNPVGAWNLDAGDNAGGDPLCVASYCITITALIPCNAPTVTLVNSAGVSCWADTNGLAAVSAAGGAGGFTYLWSNGDATASVNNLAGGTYTVTVADAVNCQASLMVIIPEPDSLYLTFTQNDVPCFGDLTGDATVTTVGGTTPFAYAWNTGGIATTETGLGAGFASVMATDSNGCVATDSTEITSPTEVIILVDTIFAVTCEGGNDGSVVTITSGGVAPYQIQWDDLDGQISPTAIGLVEGLYTIEVTDGNGCVKNEFASVGRLFDAPVIDLGPNVSASNPFYDIEAPTGFAAYSWSNGSNTNIIRVFSNGTYALTVTDDNGCTAVDDITVTKIWATGIDDPKLLGDINCFPNPTSGQLNLEITDFNEKSIDIRIIDLGGRTVFSQQAIDVHGDFKLSLDVSALAKGSYFLKLETATATEVLKVMVE